LEDYTAYDLLVAMTYNMYIAEQQIDNFLYYWTIVLKDKSRATTTSLSVGPKEPSQRGKVRLPKINPIATKTAIH